MMNDVATPVIWNSGFQMSLRRVPSTNKILFWRSCSHSKSNTEIDIYLEIDALAKFFKGVIYMEATRLGGLGGHYNFVLKGHCTFRFFTRGTYSLSVLE